VDVMGGEGFDSVYNIIYNNIDQAVCLYKIHSAASRREYATELDIIKSDSRRRAAHLKPDNRYSVSLAGKYKRDMEILCILTLF